MNCNVNANYFWRIACRLLEDGEIECFGSYRQIRSKKHDVTAHCIIRTMGADNDTHRMIIAAPPDYIEPADLHFCFLANQHGEVERLLVSERNDYFLTLVHFPYWDKKKKRMMARPPVKELENFPGFIDMTAEALLWAA